MNCEEIMKYIPEKGQNIKIIVKGTTAEINSISKLSRFKEWASMGIKVVYKTTASENNDIENLTLITKTTYIERLKNRVENSKDAEELKPVFEKIFRRNLVGDKTPKLKIKNHTKDVVKTPKKTSNKGEKSNTGEKSSNITKKADIGEDDKEKKKKKIIKIIPKEKKKVKS